MDQNRSSGATKELEGKIQEGVGRATGDAGSQLRGRMKQAEGSAQEAYGRASEAAAEGGDAIRHLSGGVEDSLRHYIENKPYTTAAIAFAVGWLIGRSHRPF